MNSGTDHSQKRILLWALGVAALLLLLTVLAVVAGFWWLRRDSQATAPPSPTAAANWSRATFNANTDSGVRQTSDKSWSVKGRRAFMNVRLKDDQSLELRFVYPFDGDFLSKEAITLVRARWGANEIAKLADELDITPEQLADLKAVPAATDIPVSREDKRRLQGLFEDYLTAPGASSEKPLVDAVAEIDLQYYEPTRERIDAIAQQVKDIFNAEQLAALSQRFGARDR